MLKDEKGTWRELRGQGSRGMAYRRTSLIKRGALFLMSEVPL